MDGRRIWASTGRGRGSIRPRHRRHSGGIRVVGSCWPSVHLVHCPEASSLLEGVEMSLDAARKSACATALSLKRKAHGELYGSHAPGRGDSAESGARDVQDRIGVVGVVE